MERKRLLRILEITIVVLLVPLVAMQFSSDVQWTSRDFITMGCLLLVTGLAYELLISRAQGSKKRLLVGTTVLFVFLTTWAELAVGVFD